MFCACKQNFSYSVFRVTFTVTPEGITLPYSHENLKDFSFLPTPKLCYRWALKICFNYLSECVYTCGYAHLSVGAHRRQRRRIPWSELWLWLLGAGLGSSVRTVQALNFWTISSAPGDCFRMSGICWSIMVLEVLFEVSPTHLHLWDITGKLRHNGPGYRDWRVNQSLRKTVCAMQKQEAPYIHRCCHTPINLRIASEVWVHENFKTTTTVAVTLQHTDSWMSSWSTHCVRHSFPMDQNTFASFICLV